MSKPRQSQTAKKGTLRLSDVAYERILDGLLEQKIPVGTFVSQSRISSIIGIPVAPLRDALHVLQAEAILTIHPRSGIEFFRPGPALTRAIYEFRSIVERYAIRIFAEQADEQLVENLIHRHCTLKNELVNDTIARRHQHEMDALEMELHAEITGSLKNPLIDKATCRIRNHLRLLWLNRTMTRPMLTSCIDEHLSILEACRQRSADAAEHALLFHLYAATQRSSVSA